MHLQRGKMDFNLIKSRADQLKAIDAKGNYNFLPVISEKEASDFETKFGINLPVSYRKFITEIAGGIESPLAFTSDVLSCAKVGDYYFESERYNPGLEFPLTRRIYAEGPEFDLFYPYETDNRSYENFDYPKFTNGQLEVMALGCGNYYFIVVNGIEFNNIWVDIASSNGDIFPAFDEKQNKKRICFEDWIVKQLEEAIQLINARTKQ